MEAIILAGGRGTRLRPVTDHVPKPLVPVRNVPLIGWQLRYLARHGIGEAVVCAGYKADMIEDYVGRTDHGVRVRLSVEDEPLGTGGAIRRAGAMAGGGSFLVMNGDVLTDIDLARVAQVPDCVASVELRTGFGVMDLDGGSVRGFREKGTVPGLWMNAGIYHLGRGSLGDLPESGDIERTLFPGYAAEGRLRAVRFPGARWHSADSLKDLEEMASDDGLF